MKKILLATTMLIGTAGFAAAEVALSGSAAMGVGRDGEATGFHKDGAFHAYSTATVTATMSGESDSGLSFGASISIGTGTSYAFADDDGFNAEALGSSSEVFLAGAFGKIAMKVDNTGFGQYKAYQTDTKKGYDLQYTHSVGGLDIGVRYDVDGDAVDGDSSVSLGYKMDALSFGLAYDASGAWGASASYAMDAITVTAATDDASVSSIKIAYSANGLSASAKVANNDTHEIALGYSANGVGVNVSTNDADEWSASASYDLGGGASLAGGMNYADDAYVGVSFSF